MVNFQKCEYCGKEIELKKQSSMSAHYGKCKVRLKAEKERINNILTKEYLIEEYVNKGISLSKISKKLKVHTRLIEKALNDYNIRQRTKMESNTMKKELTKKLKKERKEKRRDERNICIKISFIEKVKALHGDKIIMLGEFLNYKTLIKVKCNICGNIWDSLPSNLVSKSRGHGCKKCFLKNKTKTHKSFINELHIINPNIDILSDYINNKTKIECKCLICNYIWCAEPHNLLLHKNKDSIGSKCPMCSNKLKKTNAIFLKELENINPFIKPLEEYKTNKHNMKCECLKCGCVWSVKPNTLLSQKSSCPRCNQSKGERKIQIVFDKYNIQCEYNKNFKDCRDKLPLSFDFYISKYNMCIEYDGLQHFRPSLYIGNKKFSKSESIKNFIIIEKHDKIKNEYCKKHNIKLIRIPYWDYNNIETIIKKELSI